jgi:hypothetical protein
MPALASLKFERAVPQIVNFLDMKQRLVLATLLTFGLAAAAPVVVSSFLQAPAGTALSFNAVALPPVRLNGHRPAPARRVSGPLSPTFDAVLSGNLVIETDAQMKLVWEAVLLGPYDPTLFDFQNNFVVWMGGGALQLGSFDINSIERVDALWNNPLGFGGSTDQDAFLAATGLTFLPGAFPQFPPPPTWRVSAVQVSRAEFDDVVFHRTLVAAP